MIKRLLWLTIFTTPALSAPAVRVVSCTIASDEMASDILGRAGHAERLVAVSTLADDERYSNLRPVPATIKGRCGGELESLLKLKPDLAVVASFNRPELVHRLKASGIKVHVLRDFATLADIEASLTELGKALDEVNAGQAAAKDFHAEIDRLRHDIRVNTPAVRALQFFPDGAVSGGDTLFNDLVRAAGGENIGATGGVKGWPKLQTEALAMLKPDVLVASGTEADRASLLKMMRSLPGFKDMSAVKDGHLILIPERELSAASPHILKALAKLRAGFEALQKASP